MVDLVNNSEINELIIETVESSCEDEKIRNLIRSSLKYELDIWNRHILPSDIKDEYNRIVEKVLKGEKK